MEDPGQRSHDWVDEHRRQVDRANRCCVEEAVLLYRDATRLRAVGRMASSKRNRGDDAHGPSLCDSMTPTNTVISEYTVRERGRLELKGVSTQELKFLRRLEDESKITLRIGSERNEVILLTRMHCGVVQAGSKRIFI